MGKILSIVLLNGGEKKDRVTNEEWEYFVVERKCRI